MTAQKIDPAHLAALRAMYPSDARNATVEALLDHIEALEAELADKYCWQRAKDAEHELDEACAQLERLNVRLLASEGCHMTGEDPHPKLARLEKELAESRAERERLREQLDDARHAALERGER
jgi:predicted RNase H-like nuclease (RuvC/YqgF family)